MSKISRGMKISGSKPYLSKVVFAAAILELSMFTVSKNIFGVYLSTIATLLFGLITGIGIILVFYNKKCNPYDFCKEKTVLKLSWSKHLLFFLPVGLFGLLLHSSILEQPIDFSSPENSGSDIIPQIGTLITRMLNGDYPYQIIEWPGFHLFPTYLPMQWLPFTIAEILEFDYRWFAFGILALVIYYYFTKLSLSETPLKKSILLILSPFIILFSFYFTDEAVFKYSIETLIVGYYLLLSLSLFSNSKYFIGIALSLCILSRYSIILWIPLLVVVLFLIGKKKEIVSISILLTVSFLAFYALPFLWEDPGIFLKGYEYHSNAAIGAWHPTPWQAAGEPPSILYQGFGLGCFFYSFLDIELIDKLFAYRLIHLISSLLTVILLAIAFLKIKDKIDYRIFLLGSLKIYLVVFYNFIQIPFTYLFLVPIFISVPIVALLYHPKLKIET